MKIAIVHDYLNTYGGGERVLELLHEIFPSAPIFTLMYEPTKLRPYFRTWNIKTSFIDKLPLRSKLFKYYIPLMPLGIESFDFSEYDLVFSISAGFAKGVITPVSTCHISYTLTVPRFLWGYETSTQANHRKNIGIPIVNNYLRIWDRVASDRADYFVANSKHTKDRIYKSYRRNADVIYSSVDEKMFELSTLKREDFYLIVSRLDKYKSIDLAIKAISKFGGKLKIVGDGPERQKLENIGNENIEFLGGISDEKIVSLYKIAKAVIFPGFDDLGLVPIEAQMCGTPVIAFRKGGALETVIEDISGVFFDRQTDESLISAIKKLESISWDHKKVRESVQKFSKTQIMKEIKDYISKRYQEYISVNS